MTENYRDTDTWNNAVNPNYPPSPIPGDFAPVLPIHPLDYDKFGNPFEEGEWDYQTAEFDRNGNPLPDGAVGWTPFGEAHYGTGSAITEWFAQLQYNIWEKPVEPQTFQESQTTIAASINQAIEGGFNFQNILNSIGTIGRAGVGAIGGFFSELAGLGEESPEEAFEEGEVGKAIGAAAARVGGQAIIGVIDALTDLGNFTGAAIFGGREALGDIAEKSDVGELPQFGRIENPEGFWGGAWNWFYGMVDSLNTGGLAVDVGRAVQAFTSGNVTFSEAGQIIEENLQAGRIAYSSWVDPALREEFKRRFRAGENPYLLEQELQNPVAELFGELFFDPINLVGLSRIAKLDKEIGDAAKLIDFADVKTAEALKGMNLADEAVGSQKLTEAVEHITRYADESRDTATAFARADSIRDPLASSKVTKEMNRYGNFANVLMNSDTMRTAGKLDPDKFLDVMKQMGKLVSGSEVERAEALIHLGSTKLPMNMLLSDDGIRFGIMTDELLGATPKLMDDLRNIEDAATLIERYTPVLEKVTEGLYPSLTKRFKAIEKAEALTKAGKKVPASVQKLVDIGLDGDLRIVRALTNASDNKVIGFINNFYAHLYMGVSGGYVARNVINGAFTTITDLGAKAFFTKGKLNLDFNAAKLWKGKSGNMVDAQLKYLANVFGAVPAKASQGIGQVGGLVATKGRKVLKPFGINLGKGLEMAKLSEKGQSARIYAHTTREVIDKMLPRVIGNTDTLKAAGMADDQLTMLADLARFHNGDVGKVLSSFEENLGYIDSFQHLLAVDKADIATLAKHNFLDIFKEAAKLDDPVEAAKFIDAKIADAESFATEGTSAIMPGIRRGTNESKVASVMDGHIADDARHLHNARVVANQASDTAFLQMRDELVELVGQDVINKVVQENPVLQMLFDIGEVKEGKQFGMIYDMFDSPALKYMDSTVAKWEKFLEASPGEDMVAWWKEFGIAGEPPTGLTKQMLADILWDEQYERVSRMFWNARRETIFELSNKLLDALKGEDFIPPKSLVDGLGKLEDARKWQNAVFDSVGADRQMKAFFGGSVIKNDFDYITQLARRNELYELKGNLNVGSYPNVNNQTALRNALRNVEGAEDVTSLKDFLAKGFSREDAIKAIQDTRGEKFVKYGDELTDAFAGAEKAELERLKPALSGHDLMNDARAMDEAFQGGLRVDLTRIKDGFIGSWGQAVPTDFNPQVATAVKEWAVEASKRADIMRSTAIKVADARRDFALLDYGDKRNFDLALGLIFPYQFWHSRTYVNWAKRIAQHPKILSRFAKYRTTMEKIHSELPEWWRYNVNTNELLGLDSDNPIYLNLEATLNPLHQLTGVDFNDPKKRVDWFTTVLDGLNRFGPSTWSPLSLIAALRAQQLGEDEAAARWGSNLLPPLKTVEAIGSVLGDNLLGNSLKALGRSDPGTSFFSGGIDPYTRNRVGRALGAMIEDKTITSDQATEAARLQEGEIWDAAHDRAVAERAPGQISSFFMGVGFKGRTARDLTIDQFYGDYHKLFAMRHNLSPLEFQEQMGALRQQYPFMDTVLISKRGGDERDVGYAYNVMGRIPPGASSVYELVGLDRDLVSKFYDTKGQFAGNEVDGLEPWTEAERTEFMDGIVKLGAILATPENATRQEWDEAKRQSKQLNQDIEAIFGKDIRDRIDLFWDIRNEQGDEAGFNYLSQQPDVQSAMDYRDNVIANNPETLLATYYGGLKKVIDYYRGTLYTNARVKFGDDIFDIQEQFYATGGKAPAILKQYWAFSRQMRKITQAKIDEIAPLLGEGTGLQLRTDTEIPPDFSRGIEIQQQAAQALTITQQIGGSALVKEVDNFAKSGRMDNVTRELLKEVAEAMGISFGYLLELLQLT